MAGVRPLYSSDQKNRLCARCRGWEQAGRDVGRPRASKAWRRRTSIVAVQPSDPSAISMGLIISLSLCLLSKNTHAELEAKPSRGQKTSRGDLAIYGREVINNL